MQILTEGEQTSHGENASELGSRQGEGRVAGGGAMAANPVDALLGKVRILREDIGELSEGIHGCNADALNGKKSCCEEETRREEEEEEEDRWVEETQARPIAHVPTAQLH